jgi:hypothetical protein
MNLTKEKHATHTPGPWEKATIGIGTNSKQVVWLGEKTGRRIQVISTGRDEANARLIAAAPELLEQCKLFEKVLKAIGDMGYKDEIDLDSHSWLMRTMELREVLAKVEGGEG